MATDQRPLLFACAGLSCGTFMGLLIGLSRSPVVGAAIAALVPIAALCASALEKDGQRAALPTIRSSLAFVIAFFVAGALALFAGMSVRMSQGPIRSMYDELIAIKLSEADARKITQAWIVSGGLKATDLALPVLYTQEIAEERAKSKECESFRLRDAPYSAKEIDRMAESTDRRLRDVAALARALPLTGSETELLPLHSKLFHLACS